MRLVGHAPRPPSTPRVAAGADEDAAPSRTERRRPDPVVLRRLRERRLYIGPRYRAPWNHGLRRKFESARVPASRRAQPRHAAARTAQSARARAELAARRRRGLVRARAQFGPQQDQRLRQSIGLGTSSPRPRAGGNPPRPQPCQSTLNANSVRRDCRSTSDDAAAARPRCTVPRSAPGASTEGASDSGSGARKPTRRSELRAPSRGYTSAAELGAVPRTLGSHKGLRRRVRPGMRRRALFSLRARAAHPSARPSAAT